MNGPLIVATAAFLLLLPQFNNADAAGPYDGEWTGTATSAGERCKQAVVKLTVEGQGFQPLRGQFIRDQFEGAFKSFNCEWKAFLRRTR